jgi:hypothetical protein
LDVGFSGCCHTQSNVNQQEYDEYDCEYKRVRDLSSIATGVSFRALVLSTGISNNTRNGNGASSGTEVGVVSRLADRPTVVKLPRSFVGNSIDIRTSDMENSASFEIGCDAGMTTVVTRAAEEERSNSGGGKNGNQDTCTTDDRLRHEHA